MYCPKCGTFNPDDSRFCESCGSPLSVSSPAPSDDETVLLSPQKSAVSPSSDDKTILLTPSENIDTPPAPPRSEAPISGPVSSSVPDSAFQPASVQYFQYSPPEAIPSQNAGNPTKPAKPHKGKKPLVWVLVMLLVLAGLGVGGWFGWNAYQGGQYQEQLSLGEKYLKELNYEDAIIALNRAIEIDPRSPEPYLLLADVYIGQEDFNSAKKVLEEGYQATGGNEEIKKKQEEVKQKEEEAKKKQEEMNRSAVDIWEELITSGKYKDYTEDWNQLGRVGLSVFPTEYTILDINGDGWEELILSGHQESIPDFAYHSILVCDKDSKEITVLSIESLSGALPCEFVGQNFQGLEYSAQHHALIYTETNDGYMFGGNNFMVIDNNELKIDFVVEFERKPDTENNQKIYYIYQNNQRTEITKSEYSSYFTDTQQIEFKPIPESQPSSPSDDGQEQDYILAGSDSRYISKEELDTLTKQELVFARNEIYARHGRKFNDPELREYFMQFDWYTPTVEPEDFNDSMLNKYEVSNIDLIVAYEKEKGYK